MRVGSKKRKTGSGRIGPFTRGQLNRIVDAVVHPKFRENKAFVFVDGAVHAMIERDAPQTVEKFVRFNIPKLLERKGMKRRKRPR